MRLVCASHLQCTEILNLHFLFPSVLIVQRLTTDFKGGTEHIFCTVDYCCIGLVSAGSRNEVYHFVYNIYVRIFYIAFMRSTLICIRMCRVINKAAFRSIFCDFQNFYTTARTIILVKGGLANAVQVALYEAQRAKAEELGVDALYEEFRKPETTPERKAEIRKIINTYSAYSDSLRKKAVADNPHSIYALYQIPNECYDWSADSIKTAIQEYNDDKAFANDPVLKELNDQVAALEATEIGKPAPDFAFDDPDGKSIKLSDVYKQNKVTMIDFWASWCGPCRAANPTITKVYSNYKDKGFGIFGVSFDTSKENWVKAIADDGLVWPNVSDLKGWESAASALYCIRYIPQNVFVDANGTIIGKRVEPSEIEAFVAGKLAE